MRNYFIYVSVLFISISCQRKDIEKEYVYFSTNELRVNTLHNKFVKYKALLSSDSIKLFDNQDLITKFKYSITDNGIYIIKDTTSFLLYSFTDSTNVIRPNELLPSFHKSVRLVEKKDYQIKNKKRTVYHFVESGYDETLDSYYMEEEGFICFYKYAEDNFLYLDSPDAIELSSQFLTDSTFFAMLKMRETDKKMGRKFQ